MNCKLLTPEQLKETISKEHFDELVERASMIAAVSELEGNRRNTSHYELYRAAFCLGYTLAVKHHMDAKVQ
jgi:hypothetical protein